MKPLLLSLSIFFATIQPTSCFLSLSHPISSSSISKPKTSISSSSSNEESQLAQLSKVTTLSIDSGDLNIIQKYANTGYITDATTNPLFVSQVGLSENNDDGRYSDMVNNAISYAVENKKGEDEKEIVGLAIDRLAVNLGKAISEIVSGYISTEVDPRLSFDTKASIERGRRIIEMYKELGVPKERILIKLAATWEGIKAAEVLQKEGISCNLTLIFSFIQGIACAQRDVTLISPFPGRVLDWNNIQLGRPSGGDSKINPIDDEGVQVVTKMYNYYKCYNHNTICMPASWRPSRGSGYELDEIRALAGVDRMTIPSPLLEKLENCHDVLPQMLSIDKALESGEDKLDLIDEITFRYALNMDGCGTDKLAEGLRAFIGETEKLEDVLLSKIRKLL